MTFAMFITGMLILLAGVIAWLWYELRVDRRERIYPTVPGPRDRQPPRNDYA
jgi:hypothetical protein